MSASSENIAMMTSFVIFSRHSSSSAGLGLFFFAISPFTCRYRKQTEGFVPPLRLGPEPTLSRHVTRNRHRGPGRLQCLDGV